MVPSSRNDGGKGLELRCEIGGGRGLQMGQNQCHEDREVPDVHGM